MGELPSTAAIEGRRNAIETRVDIAMRNHPDSEIAAAWRGETMTTDMQTTDAPIRSAVKAGVARAYAPLLGELAPYTKAYLDRHRVPNVAQRTKIRDEVVPEINRLTADRKIAKAAGSPEDEATLRRRLAAKLAQYALLLNLNVDFPVEIPQRDSDGLLMPTETQRRLAFVQLLTAHAIKALPDL